MQKALPLRSTKIDNTHTHYIYNIYIPKEPSGIEICGRFFLVVSPISSRFPNKWLFHKKVAVLFLDPSQTPTAPLVKCKTK